MTALPIARTTSTQSPITFLISQPTSTKTTNERKAMTSQRTLTSTVNITANRTEISNTAVPFFRLATMKLQLP